MVGFDTVRSLHAGDTVADCFDDALSLNTGTAMDEGTSPLDLRHEEHRLWTLRHWPPDWARELARLGFSGVSEASQGTVLCVFCGREMTDFSSPREAQVLHWQSGHQHCRFLTGQDVGNVPLHHPHHHHHHHAAPSQRIPTTTVGCGQGQLAPAGVRFPSHNSQEENSHEDSWFSLTARHPDTTSERLPNAGGKPPSPSKLGEVGTVHWTEIVRTARYPAMAAIQARLDTLRRWPLLKPSPIELAKAGFFHVEDSSSHTTGGSRGDTVRCFWCAERIHRWQKTDDALLEHARFSPDCLFVLQRLGAQLRDDIVHVTATGNTQGVTKPTPCPHSQQPERSCIPQFPSGSGRQLEVAHPSPLTPSQLDSLMRSPAVQTVLQMGFPRELIRDLLSHNSQRLTADTLCHLALQTAGQTARAPAPPAANGCGRPIPDHEVTRRADTDRDWKPEQGLETSLSPGPGNGGQGTVGFQDWGNREGSAVCKVCSEAEVKVVFRPCNHLVCCSRCTALFTTCPLCHQVIEGVRGV